MTSRELKRRALILAAGGALAAAGFLAGCENDSDPVAPEGTTITVSASPQTVIVPAGGLPGTSTITATLRSENGTRLPNQEITFFTSAGTLTPSAQTPLKTDSNGQAVSLLSTTTSATVTASSGSVEGSTQVQTAPGDLAPFILNVSPGTITACNQTLSLMATVVTTSGDPVSGVLVIFDETSDSNLVGDFINGSQVLTDAQGVAATTWTPSPSVCSSQCQVAAGDPNNPYGLGVCILRFFAQDSGGNFPSTNVTINDNTN